MPLGNRLPHSCSSQGVTMSHTLLRRRAARSVALSLAAVTTAAFAACSADAQTPTTTAGAHNLAIAVVTPPNSLDPAQLVDGQQMFVWSSILDTLLYKENKTGALKP